MIPRIRTDLFAVWRMRWTRIVYAVRRLFLGSQVFVSVPGVSAPLQVARLAPVSSDSVVLRRNVRRSLSALFIAPMERLRIPAGVLEFLFPESCVEDCQ